MCCTLWVNKSSWTYSWSGLQESCLRHLHCWIALLTLHGNDPVLFSLPCCLLDSFLPVWWEGHSASSALFLCSLIELDPEQLIWNFVYVIAWFQVQFGVNNHKTTEQASAICGCCKVYKCILHQIARESCYYLLIMYMKKHHRKSGQTKFWKCTCTICNLLLCNNFAPVLPYIALVFSQSEAHNFITYTIKPLNPQE